MSHKNEVFCKNQFTVAEGPHWDEANQRLLFVDTKQATVHRWDYATAQLQDPLKVTDPTIGCVVTSDSGGLAIAAYHRFASLDETTGTTVTLAEVDQKNDQVQLNDGKCDPMGRFWAGSMVKEDAVDPVPNQGSLYTLNTDKSLDTKISRQIQISNGMVWSPDGTVMYYIDSPTYKIIAYKYDAVTGAISDPSTVVEIDKWLDGTADGQCVDNDGNLWVAMYGGGRVIKVDTVAGKKVEWVQISLSGLRTASCCFGGPNLDELFVTSAANVSGAPGDSGSIFKVTSLGVKGPPGMSYNG